LWDVVIIQVDEAFEDCLEGGGRIEAVGTQDIGNAAIEVFDHAVGLRPSGLDQAVFDTVIGADPIKGVVAGREALTGGAEAVGKRLAIAGEDLADDEGSLVDQALEETAGGDC